MTRPHLHTERLRLTPLTDDHLDELVELDSDPEVLRYIFGRALGRPEVVERMRHRTRPDADARGLGYWVGHHGTEFVGWWCLAVDDSDDRAAELGYRLCRSKWRQGYAVEGSRALIQHGFQTVGLDQIWAETMTANTGSRRVMERLGMRYAHPALQATDQQVLSWEQGGVRYVLDA